ncbi:hypothetical protein EHI8A_110140 [Entamoeba histolytica HM-1:IMSS-B]|uniref:Uncharacterized protein n=6 Tax=Entamoeba histolytica TaxID=5759 RepID=C4LZ82_ENTH1|nr:hypothetical protein EHI_104740 [Entamoeba histolytica HM-1:IMSS]EMD43884.1 Hypothetical protein EHI5A_136060 [Entamoeba histolytica KU27]EMH73253.1 hypothetical protein EHI8A_110140 [Entamoeba histolytica HM-1:IMSS-B]EMS16085.1 hypothetical protein KM1_025890 [Entamoeba histolytica HM-3:IMSS]ENY62828.1 hypothetical protein EHI7A_102240 [Entamoeba histolytica HM-1:IMSS-A]BAN39103.1 hypothetical protein [Entamoeba histolytica]|eukprot:XP_650586.1 hypothetical protein EHI_104740 [Entamoeba histolytica HM-1:IMSS]
MLALFLLVSIALAEKKEYLAVTNYTSDGNMFYGAPLNSCLTYYRFLSNGNSYYVKFSNTEPKVQYYVDEYCTSVSGAAVAPVDWEIKEVDIDFSQITIPSGKGIPLYIKPTCAKISNEVSFSQENDGTTITLKRYSDDHCDDSYLTQKMTCQDENVYNYDDDQYLFGEGQKARVICGSSLLTVLFISAIVLMLI